MSIDKIIWKDIIGYEGLYQVSDTGLVKSCRRIVSHPRWGYQTINEKILKPGISRGYLRVALCKNGKAKNLQIHRLVLIAFVPNPFNKKTGNHIDSIRSNNHVSNLEWATNKENSEHATIHGDIKRGQDHPESKLTTDQVIEIKKDSRYHKDIAADYGVCQATVSHIKNNRSWQHV